MSIQSCCSANLVLSRCFFRIVLGSIGCLLKLCLDVVLKSTTRCLLWCVGLFSAGLGVSFSAYYLRFAWSLFG